MSIQIQGMLLQQTRLYTSKNPDNNFHITNWSGQRHGMDH